MKSRITGVEIKAICCAVPRQVMRIDSLTSVWRKDEIRKIIKTSGIEEVRIADEETTAADLCVEAAENIFKNKNFGRDSIDGIVFVTQTPDYILPATSYTLQSRLKISNEAVAIDVNQGCSGYVYGVFVSALLVASGSCESVLLMVGDTTSKLISASDRSLRTIFGDCGSATIIGKGDGSLCFRIKTYGERYDRLIVPAGGMRMPRSEETSVVRDAENGNRRSLDHFFMDGLEIMQFTLSDVPPLVEQLLSDVSWAKTDVGCYVFHQANEFIVRNIARKLNLPAEVVPIKVSKYGNTGPTTIPLTLVEFFNNDAVDYSVLKKTVCVGFGTGLSVSAFTGNLSRTQFLEVQEL